MWPYVVFIKGVYWFVWNENNLYIILEADLGVLQIHCGGFQYSIAESLPDAALPVVTQFVVQMKDFRKRFCDIVAIAALVEIKTLRHRFRRIKEEVSYYINTYRKLWPNIRIEYDTNKFWSIIYTLYPEIIELLRSPLPDRPAGQPGDRPVYSLDNLIALAPAADIVSSRELVATFFAFDRCQTSPASLARAILSYVSRELSLCRWVDES